MSPYTQYLDSIQQQQKNMTTLLHTWGNINSGTENLQGLAQMHTALQSAFASLGGTIESIPLRPHTKIDSKGRTAEVASGSALRITKHPHAPISVLLGGHMDTVYPADSPFQKVELVHNHIIRGPGVADMKGGLVILLKALECLESSPYAGKIGWEVLINPDEEIGSPSSEGLWLAAAENHDFGLIFEPSFPDGSVVTSRKGSVNFTVVAKGRAAHSGRDFYLGRSAISAVMRFLIAAEKINDPSRGITVNIGFIEGGGPVNIVPEFAISRLNIRLTHGEDLAHIRDELSHLIAKGHEQEGISLILTEHTARPPKPFDKRHQTLFYAIERCGKELALQLPQTSSGGACDGNILTAAGLPNIDTLGAVGGNIHTFDEYVILNSLSERATLTAYFLMKAANQEIELPL